MTQKMAIWVNKKKHEIYSVIIFITNKSFISFILRKIANAIIIQHNELVFLHMGGWES